MPVIDSAYQAPRLLKNSHIHTVLCALYRRRPKIAFYRERLELGDGDFLDLDWAFKSRSKLMIITHGMEGSSSSKYVLHTTKKANEQGYSVVAWNLRGCSGESNRKQHFYHSGITRDLAAVVDHAKSKGFSDIYLVGFSLGGNLTLLYMGQQGEKARKSIRGCVAFSSPVDLVASQAQIEKFKNRIYLKRFLKDFRAKFERKRFTKGIYIDIKNFNRDIKTLGKLDADYTAPWNGFSDEIDYYQKCSALPYLSQIQVPTLLINPLDDTFLAQECYPYEIAKKSKYFFLETPRTGGHCAMLNNLRFDDSYIEQRVCAFFSTEL